MINKKLMNKLKRVHPGSFFLIVSLISGLTFLIITPPFQVPDEINHFYRSYQISDGKFLSENVNQRLGGYIPESFVKTTEPFLGLRGNMNSKTNFKIIRNQFSIPLNENDKIFIDFPNTALYSPVSYIPQAFSIFILKKLNISPIFIFYGARMFTLLIWIICIWFAIKITPIYKWLFALLALLPMSIFTNMSLSADVVTNILAFLLIAYFLKLTFEDKKIDLKDFLIIICLSVLLASAKVVYTPIILLFLLIPKENFRSIKEFYSCFILIIVIGFGTAIFWSKIISIKYIPYKEYNIEFRDGIDLKSCANMYEQLEYILNHVLSIFEVIVISIFHTFDMYYRGYIGTFGWLDTKLPIWLIHIAYIIIIFVAILENNKNLNFNIFQRYVILGSLIANISLVLLSQELTWNCVGNKLLHTIQGRYFIPAFPLLFILFNNSKYNKQSITKVIVILLSITLLCFSTWTLYSRYYIAPVFDSIKIGCDAEKLTSDKKFFKTSIHGIFFENGDRRSNRYSRSGNFSIELFSEKPYGFTYRLYNGKMGDVIEIEVWRFGKSGGIVLAGESGRSFYLSSSKAVETDAEGWEKIQCSYTLQSNMKGKEIGIYLYNNNNDTSYFDDLSISINKLK